MIQALHFGKDGANLGRRKDHGQFELRIGADQLQFVRPLALEGLFPEALESADELGGGLAGDLLDRLEVNAVLADLLEGDQLGGAIVILADLPDTSRVSFFGAGTDRQQLEVIGEGF